MHDNFFLHPSLMAAAAAVAAVLAVAAAPPSAAGPAEPNALQVIMMLQRQGHKVIVKRVGDKPMQMCTATSVREGKSEYWWTRARVVDPNRAKRANGVGAQLLYRTMYVDVQC